MEKNEKIKIKKQIVKNQELINKRLLEFGIPSKTITIDEGFTTLNISRETSRILDMLIKSLYGYSFDAIKTSFYLKGNHKLTDLVPDNQLIVLDLALDSLRDNLYNAKEFNKTEIEKSINSKGYELRAKYKNNTGMSLLDGLKKKNSNDTFKDEVLEKLKNIKSADEEEVHYSIEYYKENLQKILPNKFQISRYYGTIIGTYNLAFYGMSLHDILSFIREQGVKFSGNRIEDLSSNEMNQYLYTGLDMIYNMLGDFKINDKTAFENKVILLATILKNDYIESYGKEPLLDMVEYLKNKKGIKSETKKPRTRKRNYAFNKKQDSVRSNTFEQLILTDKNE